MKIFNLTFDLGYESNQYNTRVIHNIVNDRSDLTLKDVISRLQSDVYSDKATMTTIVKTICKRYFTGTSVSFKCFQCHFQLSNFVTVVTSPRIESRVFAPLLAFAGRLLRACAEWWCDGVFFSLSERRRSVTNVEFFFGIGTIRATSFFVNYYFNVDVFNSTRVFRLCSEI